jgi:hypothetical protein
MLAVYQNNLSDNRQNARIISRIFTAHDGTKYRMTFAVALVGGELKGKLLSVEPLAAEFGTQRVPCLSATCENKEVITEYVPAFAPVVSPYASLLFFISQPIRAPSQR